MSRIVYRLCVHVCLFVKINSVFFSSLYCQTGQNTFMVSVLLKANVNTLPPSPSSRYPPSTVRSSKQYAIQFRMCVFLDKYIQSSVSCLRHTKKNTFPSRPFSLLTHVTYFFPAQQWTRLPSAPDLSTLRCKPIKTCVREFQTIQSTIDTSFMWQYHALASEDSSSPFHTY